LKTFYLISKLKSGGKKFSNSIREKALKVSEKSKKEPIKKIKATILGFRPIPKRMKW